MAVSPQPPSIVALPGAHASGVVWRHRGTLRITVIAKATFALVHGSQMTVTTPRPIRTSEAHHGNLPNRSIREAVDLAPRCDLVDVVLTGHAYAPGGHATEGAVRFAILDGERAVLDKRLLLVEPAGFARMPLVYERTSGGIGRADNPLGTATPSILDPQSPDTPAGFAPLSRGWLVRRRLLGGTPRKALDAPVLELPDDFDLAYFQSAPPDQRVPELRGDERVVLEGMHPHLPLLESRLPGVRGTARVTGLPGGAAQVPLRIEGLQIDADEPCCAVVLRGSFEVPDEATIGAVRVVVAVEPATAAEGAASGPEATEKLPALGRGRAPMASTTVVLGVPEGTFELSEADLEITDASVDLSEDVTLVKAEKKARPREREIGPDAGMTIEARPDTGPALPFREKAAGEESPAAARARAFVPEDARATIPLIVVDEETAPIARRPTDASAGDDSTAITDEETTALSDEETGKLPIKQRPPLAEEVHAPIAGRAEAAAGPIVGAEPIVGAGPIVDEETAGLDEALLRAGSALLPFDAGAEPALPERASVPPPRQPTDTLYLQPEEQVSAASRALLPFITTGKEDAHTGERAAEDAPFIPERRSDAIPIVTSSSLACWTLPWQVLSGRDVRTVVVKGTFDIVPGKRAALRPETEPPSGDVHEGGDPGKELLYPSDFAIFKPKADITLRAHAYAPGGSARAMEAGLRFGHAGNAFDRKIAVLGDRHWQRGAPTEPAAFERIPIVYNRAFGGPDFAANPLGRGRAAGADGHTALPNLEDRAHPVSAPSSAPAPVCFAAVPASFRARASKLGTFDAHWVEERWPYFPDDFDWSYFQAAPEAQQLDMLSGDEPFSMWGVRPGGARVSGKLPGLVPRAFAQRTTAAGGVFFEIVLRLDTVTIDADAMTMNVVWRGIFDVADSAASDIAEIYLLAVPASEPQIDRRTAQRRYQAVRGPWVVVPEDPDAPRVANAARASARGARPDPSSIVGARLRAVGLGNAGGVGSAGGPGSSGSAGGAAVGSPPSPAPVGAPDAVPVQERDHAALRAEVEARVARGDSLVDLDLTGAELTGIDLAGAALANVIFKDARLASCKLRGADLSGAVLAGADLEGADLAGAKLAGADLTRAELAARRSTTPSSGADFTSAQAEGATFRRARGGGRAVRRKLTSRALRRRAAPGRRFHARGARRSGARRRERAGDPALRRARHGGLVRRRGSRRGPRRRGDARAVLVRGRERGGLGVGGCLARRIELPWGAARGGGAHQGLVRRRRLRGRDAQGRPPRSGEARARGAPRGQPDERVPRRSRSHGRRSHGRQPARGGDVAREAEGREARSRHHHRHQARTEATMIRSREEIVARVRAGSSLAGETFEGVNLDGLSLAGTDLTGAVFTRCTARHTRFAGATLEDASLAGTDLTGADLTEAALEGAVFEGAVLDDAALDDARAHLLNFTGASLKLTSARRVDLTGALLRGADLTSADLTSATLSNAVLEGANLTGAVLEAAALDGADLSAATLEQAVFTGANLQRARLARAVGASAAVRAGHLRGAIFEERLTLLDFTRADLSGARLSGCALLRGVRGASLVEADLAGADLRSADLTGGPHARRAARRASHGRTLTGARLGGVDLRGERIERARLSRVDLTTHQARGRRADRVLARRGARRGGRPHRLRPHRQHALGREARARPRARRHPADQLRGRRSPRGEPPRPRSDARQPPRRRPRARRRHESSAR
ncbi:MAG: DUF2169 domain-containing protein [Polyangiaceae bacterium]